MNGAECILRTLKANGVDAVFTNPGTSEMQLVAALDAVDGVRPVLGLFEGVCTGAADGYWRMARRPAATLLHLGPGLANGLANLHNARRAGSGVVNIVGDHATRHLALDAPLTSDIAGLAAPMSHTVDTLENADAISRATADACARAKSGGGAISTLIVPADLAWSPAACAIETAAAPGDPDAPEPSRLAAAADALRAGAESVMLFLGGRALCEDGLAAADRIRRATGCRLARPTFNGRTPRGRGRPAIDRTPYLSEFAEQFFAGVSTLILLGADEPVAFFAYPDKSSRYFDDSRAVIAPAPTGVDPLAALQELAERFPGGDAARGDAGGAGEHPGRPSGVLTPDTIGLSVARRLPPGAVVVDESITSGLSLPAHTEHAAAHEWLDLTGGAIGQGLPLAVGAAIAAPDRKVLTLEGDGSALYTIQALWTQARENLNVTTVIYNNRSYAILQMEMLRTGANAIGDKAMSTLDLANPAIDFCGLARSFGVDAARAETAEGFDDLLAAAMERPGPFLIEAMI